MILSMIIFGICESWQRSFSPSKEKLNEYDNKIKAINNKIK